MIAVFGKQGPQVIGWLPIHAPHLVAMLHQMTALVSAPVSLAAVMKAAGSAPRTAASSTPGFAAA